MDVVEITRITRSLMRFGEQFLRRVLTHEEYVALPTHPESYVAACFAGKEAAVKTLGTGFTCGIGMEYIPIHNIITTPNYCNH